MKPVTLNETFVEPLVLTATLLLGLAVLALPRRYAAVPAILVACFLPVGQRVALAEFDFTMLRLLLLFAWVRVLLRGDFRGLRFGALDYAFFGWITIASVIFTIGRGTVDDAIWRMGISYDLIGLYVLFRCCVRDMAALRVAIVASACSAIFLAAFMSIEFTTGRNFFSVLGGVPEFTKIRQGRLRCQATFSHPIMAGSVGASLAPLCLWLVVQKGRGRVLGALGLLASTSIVVFSASSGPLLGLVAGLGACGLWLTRNFLAIIRWSVVAVLLMLHVTANRPVWHWIGSMDLLGGSTSYHRVNLINGAIDHFSEWALLGTDSTYHWGWHLFDITNQYILEGVRGGIWTMMALVVLLAFAFRNVGRAVRQLSRVPRVPGGRRNAQLLCWALGASLFVHAVNFMGVSYFGQIQVFLVLSFAMIAAAHDTAHSFEQRPARSETPSRVRALLRPTAPATP